MSCSEVGRRGGNTELFVETDGTLVVFGAGLAGEESKGKLCFPCWPFSLFELLMKRDV
jgi:hypothetical protein